MTDFASAISWSSTVPGSTGSADAVTVACLHRDPETRARLVDDLETADSLVVDRATDPSAVLETLDAIDCVVADGEVGPDLLGRIRDADARVPVVLYTDAPLEPLLEGVLDAGWVDVVRPEGDDGDVDLLAHRIRSLVDHRRTAALAHRATVAAEAATDGLAVVAPDGTIAFANGQFARQFGYPAADLADRPWEDLFTDETVARLEADAFAAVDDGWQWVGTCEGRRDDGTTVTLRTRVTDAADGAVVLAVFQQAPDGSD